MEGKILHPCRVVITYSMYTGRVIEWKVKQLLNTFSEEVIELNAKSIIKIKGIAVQIDPLLLFQPLTVSAKAAGSIENMLKYELCGYPPALLDSLTRQSQKSALCGTH